MRIWYEIWTQGGMWYARRVNRVTKQVERSGPYADRWQASEWVHHRQAADEKHPPRA